MPLFSTPVDLETNRRSETLSRLCNLPRLNSSAARLLGVSNNIDSALEEFAAIFGSEPSLAVELLRVANSAQFELRASVSSLQVALMLLGSDGTRDLAFTIALSSHLHRGLSEVQIRPLWLHSVATAVIAEQIGCCVAPGLTGMYTAGLTHDLGRLGLLQLEGQRYGDMLGKTFSGLEQANAMEKSLFGLTHAEAGDHLARTWGFPPVLCQSIRTHHTCLTKDDGMPQRITQQACILAAGLGYPELSNCPVPEPAPGVFEEFLNRPELAHKRLQERIQLRIQMV